MSSDNEEKTKSRVQTKVKRRIFLFVIIIAIVIVMLSMYFHRLSSADLLTDWKTSGSVITNGSSRFYVVNSDNGEKTYVPKFLLPLLGYNDKPTYEEISEWQSKFRGFEPEFNHNAQVAGWLDSDNIIFTVNTGDYLYNVYVYNITNNHYEVITSQQDIIQCLAGKGKIFYTTPIEYDSPDGVIPVAEAYEPIYKYYPNSDELIKVGQYMIFPRNLNLVMVLK